MSLLDAPIRDARPAPKPAHGPALLGPSVLSVVALATALALTAYQAQGTAEQIVLFVLALLAVVGVFFLFGAAVGLVQLGERAGAPDAVHRFAEEIEDAIELIGAGGRIVFANAALHRLAGPSTSGASALEQLLGTEPQAAEAYFRLARAAEHGQTAEEIVRLTRHGLWLRLSAMPLDAAPRGALTAWRAVDITNERSHNEHALRRLGDSQRYLDSLPLGFVTSTAEGNVEHMNATLAGWLGLDPRTASRTPPRLADIMAGDTCELLLAAPAGPATGAAAGNEGPIRVDVDLKRRDGSGLPVRILHQPALAAEGAAGRARTLVLNRSPGEALDEDARAAEVRFARLFHSAPFGVATVARDGRIISANGTFAKIFSRSKRGGIHTFPKIAAMVADEAQRRALQEALDAAFDGKPASGPLEVSFGGPRETTRRFYFGATPGSGAASAGEAGPDVGPEAGHDAHSAILYVIDTTEQRALELKFAQSQKMEAVGQLAGGIAHDFNNVLTAIIGFSDLLLQNQRPTDPAFKDIVNIKSNADRAAGLVRQLLAFSRRQTLQPEIISLSEVISDFSFMLSRYITEKVNLKLVHGRDLWFVKADRTQLEQVLMNLAVNARDAMPGGGTLTVRTRNLGERESVKLAALGIEAGEYVLCEVEDTGTGMTPEIMAKIFEPFFSTKDVGKGTGLGLSTVYGIVKQTGGFIYPESTPGKGTSFRVYLPRYVPAAQEVEAAQKLAEKKERDKDRPRDLTGTGCVLLVEDEDAVRNFAKRALERQGYEVLEASTGTEALDIMAVSGDRVDLVVSDVVMPEMDGPTLLTNLRKRWPGIKVIFVSGYPDDAFRKSLAEGEQFEFLAKPFRLPQLAAKVKETMAG